MIHNKQLLDFSLKQNVVCINDSNDSCSMVVGYVKMMITLLPAVSLMIQSATQK